MANFLRKSAHLSGPGARDLTIRADPLWSLAEPGLPLPLLHHYDVISPVTAAEMVRELQDGDSPASCDFDAFAHRLAMCRYGCALLQMLLAEQKLLIYRQECTGPARVVTRTHSTKRVSATFMPRRMGGCRAAC